MDLPEKENKTGGYPHDDFCPCRCSRTFAGAHVVGHQPDEQMERFKFMLDYSDEAVEMCTAPLAPGELIRVVKGPLKGLEGELVEMDGKAKVVVRLDLLGCAGVDMPVGFVEKIK